MRNVIKLMIHHKNYVNFAISDVNNVSIIQTKFMEIVSTTLVCMDLQVLINFVILKVLFFILSRKLFSNLQT